MTATPATIAEPGPAPPHPAVANPDFTEDMPNATAITDTRVIDFNPGAIRVAAESVGVSVLRLPPNHRIKSVALRPQTNSIYLDYGIPGLERMVSEVELAALLIAYCIAAKIPMPMKAEKRLRVTPSSIAFGLVTVRKLPPWATLNR